MVARYNLPDLSIAIRTIPQNQLPMHILHIHTTGYTITRSNIIIRKQTPSSQTLGSITNVID